ncbi:MAG TPA: autotransporter domain-containing protein [Candidatus Anaerobiospirillum stercoravium]|nr:autotransporter domain-containing protein [Candidatus Anaerobiospirillum stercoravium]
MKLSNNALNFLLAQYRAIFKRAYAKGIAPAIMLTAALAMGQAQAADITTSGASFDDWTIENDITISGTVSGDFSNKIVNSLTIGAGASLSNNATTGNSEPLCTNKLTVDGGSLTIDNSQKSPIGNNGYGVLGWNEQEDQANIGDGTSIFTVKGDATVSLTKTSVQFKRVNLLDGKITLGTSFGGAGSGSNFNTAIQAGYDSEGTGVMTIGSSDGTGPEITMNSGSTLSANNIEMNGGTITMNGEDQDYASGTDTALIYLSVGDNRVANFNAGELKVTGNGGIFGPELNFQGTDVTIAEDGELALGKITVFNSASASTTSDITFSTGTSVDNQGTLTLHGDTTFNGAELTNVGTVNFSGDTMSLDSATVADLFASGDADAQGSLKLAAGADVVVTGDTVFDLSALKLSDTDGSTSGSLVALGNNTWTQDKVQVSAVYDSANLALNVKELTAKTATHSGVAAKDYAFAIKQGTISVSDRVTLLDGSGSSKADPDHRIYVIAQDQNTTATLNLVNDGSTQGQLINVDRVYAGYDAGSSKASGTSTINVDGSWDFGGARLAVNTSGTVNLGGTVENISLMQIETAGEINVDTAANVTVGRLLGGQKSATGSINVNGTLTFTGDGNPDDKNSAGTAVNDIKLTTASIAINNGGTLAIKGDAVDNVVNASGDVITDNWTASKVTLNAGGTLSLDLTQAGVKKLTTAELADLKKGLVSNATKGAFNFGSGLTIEVDSELQTDIDNGEVNYSDLVNAGINNVQGVNGVDGQVTVTVDDNTNGSGINLGNNAAAVKLTGSDTALNVSGSLIMTNNGGNFVYSEDATTGLQTVKGVTVNSDSAVNLTGSGTVGDITEANSATGTSAKLTGTGAGLNVQGSISLDTVDIGTGTVNTTGAVTANEKLNVDGILNVAQGSGDVTIGTSGATIAGGLYAGDITSSGKMDVTGSVYANSISIDAGNNLTVGDATSTGYVEVETLDLNGGMLLIDPPWSANSSFVVVTGAQSANTNNPGDDTIDVSGSIGVGQNSVGVFGTTNVEARESLIRLGLLNGGKLDQNGIGAVLYLDDTLAVAEQEHVLVDKTKLSADLSSELNGLTTSSSGSVTLRNGSALVISESFTDTLVNDPSQAIFEFGATTGSVSVTAESGAQIIFDSADILGGDSVNVANVAGGVTETYDLNDADITAAGGLLEGEDINNDGTITFKLAQGAADQLYNQSNPVRDMTLDVIGNTNGAYDSSDAGVYYIGAMNAHNGGADIERTARMAVYAGAVQATLMAQQTSTDAVSERLGMANPNSALIASNNGQGGGLWLSPVYKNHDSDGFEAEGVNYGADIDLYGLALGADFTTESGVRVGAMFNVGSGDAEGQGMGESVSNDFDYYGFTLYAGVTFGNFALTADAGFTQVSNDLEQAVNYHGVGTLTADTDTQTVSVGVRGEYLFATPYVDIVPHVGLRYTNLDMDSYEARFNGYTVAATDADNMSVFSIPFGVTFSKEMSMGNWLVKPVFDLNLTANAGDDELDTNTTFVGVESIALTSEVMDSFTYGASLGIDAQYQESISFGLNVGYTGSSNADEFGLNANARYVF